ncbi:2S globulin, Glycoside hydrolase, catalytic domain-containing protein [Artemisia annua]|uniref:2S globulin, Glycoside hydrolase, catalytic domain-containing protein n=1 Tax=Artemisia annua TaxID=35608 RepID=A0A2U1PCF3_ARTAN|nr:2S globulin, Glycoside hydrolase, catalytic domain-containing protein [Artemisia annua]
MTIQKIVIHVNKPQPLLGQQHSSNRFAEVAGGTTAECAAVCCCFPIGLVNLLVLAVYGVPAGLYRKALKKKRRRKMLKKFYAYDKETTVSQFMTYFETQRSNYGGGSILASFISDGSGGLLPQNGFFTACSRLKSQGKLGGIFVWSADDSKALGFKYEKQSQALLAVPH